MLRTSSYVMTALVLFGWPLFGQPREEPVRLTRLLEEARLANPHLKAARAGWEAATKRPSQEGTLPDPRISVRDFGVGQPFSTLNTSNFAFVSLGVSQEIPFPGKLNLRENVALEEARAEEQRYRQLEFDVFSQVKLHYYDYYYAVKALETVAKDRDLLQQFVKIAEARYSVGRGIQQDILRAQLELTLLRDREEGFQQQRDSAIAAINTLLDRSPDETLGPPEELKQAPFPTEVAELCQEAQQHSPELRAQEHEVSRQAVALNLSRKEYRPDFRVAFEWQRTGSMHRDYYVAAFEAKIPLYFWRKQRLGVEEAASKLVEARHAYRAKTRDLLFEIKDHYLMARAADRLVSLYRSAIIPQATLALESAISAYEVGSADFLTLISAATVLLDYELEYMRTQLEQHTAGPREEIGLTGGVDDPNIGGIPGFRVSGLTSLGSASPAAPIPASGSGNVPGDKWGRIFQFIDNLSWVRNRHTLKMGVEVQRVHIFTQATSLARPQFNFNGVFTQNPQGRSGTGEAYADFLFGMPNTSAVSTAILQELANWSFHGYIQDDWKVSRKLTLNLGLRYELTTPFVEVNDRQGNFIVEPGPLQGTFVYASNPGDLGRALVKTDFNNFAPRIGLAYQVAPRTVVRSGFGVFYGRDENLGPAARLGNNPPFFVRTDYVTDQITPNIILSEGIPSNALDPERVVRPTVASFSQDFPMPYVLQWNFNIQHQLPGRVVGEVGYVGSGGRRLFFWNRPNTPLTPGPGNVNARRPFLDVGTILHYIPMVTSSYNALLAKAERRFANGYSFLVSYTWAHSLDAAPNANDRNDPIQNYYDLSSNWGSSNFDRTHRFVFSHVYELPFGNSSNTALKAIAGGWQISGILSLQTGQPFTVTLNRDPSNTGVSGRPDRIADGSLPSNQRDRARWFDVTAFEAPPSNVFRFGNSGRGILRAPRQFNLDLGVARNFSITERVRLQFRSEFFNLTNTPQFGLPASTIGPASAGVISSVVALERQIQFGLRLSF